ncbi:MAG TPA: N-acetylmuramoyl-L-alanine amidase [Candidatus Choladousia intestinigallinarum]|nr:N-acetylmuramoyl-L-alanine amidase [Candidatus Choladousia intestinigallinarum]
MAGVLLLVAFFLPRAGAKWQEAVSTESSMEGKGTIILDPGHGGRDPGMTGSTGVNEKELNLVYAKKLKELLEQAGYEVIMTRETEEGLYDEDAANKKAQDMQRRCALIEEVKPLLTVSIHQNSYQDSSVRGPQVFYYEHSTEGQKLASMIQKQLNEELTETTSRQEKANSTYYILKQSKGTAVIVECGFLTNPQEEALLIQEDYQNRAAAAICRGILEYLGE